MEKLCLFLILAVLSSQALAMSFRHKRQSGNESAEDLEDRYGWNRPNQGNWGFNPRPWMPNPFPGVLPDPTPFPPQNPTQGQDQTRPTPNDGQNGNPTPTPNSNQNVNNQACLRNCPVTSEYNPVCGTNNVTYINPSRLFCAQSCGVTVNLLRSSRCPAAAAPAN